MARADRTGNRKRRDSFPTRRPELGYYFIVTDTAETEENYFYGLRDSLPESVRGRIVIKVAKTRTASLVEVCGDLAAMQPQYAEPWIVFDRDQVVDFDRIIESAECAGIGAGWSNPCIEVWFEAYFGSPRIYQDSVSCCREFSALFEKWTGQKYKKSTKEIYALLNRYGDEYEAVKVAEGRLRQYLKAGNRNPSEMDSCTTVHRLVSEIKAKTE